MISANVKESGSSWLERPNQASLPLEGSCAIGRSADSHVVLNDERISRRHAVIHSQGEREFWLVDLGSRNGTYVNQRRVSQPVRLHDGDHIQIGPFELVFRQALDPSASFLGQATAIAFKTNPCWMLLADIIGSTEAAQRVDTLQMAALTGKWVQACKEVIEGNSGMINKYLGDGLLAYWPSTGRLESRVAAALRQLSALQATSPTRFRFVLHHGSVTMGGMATLGEESLTGREVNFIFRMEKLASRLQLSSLLSHAARDQLGSAVVCVDAGSHSLEGFESTFPFFTLSQ
jgi:class 3 adenylate cyclase